MTTIEVFADVSCAFTHYGLSHLAELRSARRLDFVLRVRAWPLEWVNDRPIDPDAVERQVTALRRGIAPDLFAGFDPEVLPTSSIPALGLAAAAYETDDETGEAVSFALRDTLFEHGRDISDPSVLDDVATRFGIDPPSPDAADAAVRSDWADGQSRGVVGSPHFFTPGGDGVFCPSLEITKGEGGPQIEYRADIVEALLAGIVE
ncbi:MAG: DsbA family protein [Acidimicrobiia bacterium]|nr:DsbA family protein [Acidimicrobiia bacterium]